MSGYAQLPLITTIITKAIARRMREKNCKRKTYLSSEALWVLLCSDDVDVPESRPMEVEKLKIKVLKTSLKVLGRGRYSPLTSITNLAYT